MLSEYGSISFTGLMDNYPKLDIRTERPPFVLETKMLDEQMHHSDPVYEYEYSAVARLPVYDARLSEGSRQPGERPYAPLHVKGHEGRPIPLSQNKFYGYSQITEDVMRPIYSPLFVTVTSPHP